jgi:hypothetical protein
MSTNWFTIETHLQIFRDLEDKENIRLLNQLPRNEKFCL